MAEPYQKEIDLSLIHILYLTGQRLGIFKFQEGIFGQVSGNRIILRECLRQKMCIRDRLYDVLRLLRTAVKVGGLEMREILFKAKRLDNGEWVKGSLIST